MEYQMTEDVTWPRKACCDAVRSAILATAWLLVLYSIVWYVQPFWTDLIPNQKCRDKHSATAYTTPWVALAHVTNITNARVFSRPYCCAIGLYSVASIVCRRLHVTWSIVAKGSRCVLEQKLLLTTYRKSFMRNRLVPKWMTLTFV